jgi:hypothetical protein
MQIILVSKFLSLENMYVVILSNKFFPIIFFISIFETSDYKNLIIKLIIIMCIVNVAIQSIVLHKSNIMNVSMCFLSITL